MDWNKFIKINNSNLFHYTKGLYQIHADAEDALYNAYLVVLEKGYTTESGNLNGLIKTIIRNKFYDEYKKRIRLNVEIAGFDVHCERSSRRKWQYTHDHWFMQEPFSSDPFVRRYSEIDSFEVTDQIDVIKKSLPKGRLTEIKMLSEGYSCVEIANAKGISVQGVLKRMRVSRREVKSLEI